MVECPGFKPQYCQNFFFLLILTFFPKGHIVDPWACQTSCLSVESHRQSVCGISPLLFKKECLGSIRV
jgi:hypothetical protein